MDKNTQQELVRLWTAMRKARGPAVEEIRIQILAKFTEQENAGRAA